MACADCGLTEMVGIVRFIKVVVVKIKCYNSKTRFVVKYS